MIDRIVVSILSQLSLILFGHGNLIQTTPLRLYFLKKKIGIDFLLLLLFFSMFSNAAAFNGRHMLLLFRLPQIYEELYHTVNNADHDKDLKWWSFNHGVNMGMNWPQFEVPSFVLFFVFFCCLCLCRKIKSKKPGLCVFCG